MALLQSEIAGIKAEIDHYEKAVFANFSNRVYIENYLSTQSKHQARTQEIQSVIRQIQSELSSLNSQLNYEKNKQYSHVRTKLTKQLEQTNQEIKDLAAHLQKLKSDEEKDVASKQSITKEIQKVMLTPTECSEG